MAAVNHDVLARVSNTVRTNSADPIPVLPETVDGNRNRPAGRTGWSRARLLGGIVIIGAMFWRLGVGPVLDGLAAINGWSLAAAAGLAALTTLCCAWRWSLVARGLGVGLPIGTAFGAYYRSQFLNTTLPGGVLGDVHRGVSHGRDVGAVGLGLRAVGWERVAGQVVLLGLAGIVLLVLPSPVRSSMPMIVGAAAAAGAILFLVFRIFRRRGPAAWRVTLRAAGADVRGGLLAGRNWPGIVVASTVVVAGHTATFLLAARTAGTTASTLRLLPLALVVLLAMAVPTNVGGWGPREGVAAWVFAAAGLTAAQGLAAAVVYGVMVFVSVLPGGIVLLVTWIRSERRPDPAVDGPRARDSVLAGGAGAHG